MGVFDRSRLFIDDASNDVAVSRPLTAQVVRDHQRQPGDRQERRRRQRQMDAMHAQVALGSNSFVITNRSPGVAERMQRGVAGLVNRGAFFN